MKKLTFKEAEKRVEKDGFINATISHHPFAFVAITEEPGTGEHYYACYIWGNKDNNGHKLITKEKAKELLG